MLTWPDRARRDDPATVPGDNPASPPLGVFSTRLPDRPNPIGLHRAQILAVEGLRILVSGLEALDHTPVIDIKPVLDPGAERQAAPRDRHPSKVSSSPGAMPG